MITHTQIIDTLDFLNIHDGLVQFARAIETLVTQEKDKRIAELGTLAELRFNEILNLQCEIDSLKESLALAQDIIDTEPKPQQVEQSHAQASPDSVRDAALEEYLDDVLVRVCVGVADRTHIIAQFIKLVKSQAPSQSSDAKDN